MLVIILCAVIAVLGGVVIILCRQINKMILSEQELDEQYKQCKQEKRNLQEDLEDSQYENDELRRKLAEAEDAAQKAQQERDNLLNSKTFPMGPAGWNVVFEGKEENK